MDRSFKVGNHLKIVSLKDSLKNAVTGKHGILYLIIISKILFGISIVSLKLTNREVTNCNWDCKWYLTIIENGYQTSPNVNPPVGAANWAFFPVMPYLVRFFEGITRIDPMYIAIFLNTSALYIGLIFLEKLIERNSKKARLTSAVIAFSPLSVYINTLYTEAIYFMLVIIVAYCLKERLYAQAVMAASVVSATRVTGIIISSIVCVVLLNAARKGEIRKYFAVLGCIFSFLGVLLFSISLNYLTGDYLAFLHIQSAWGTGNTSFIEWIAQVLQFNSPTLLVYFLLFLFTLGMALISIKNREYVNAGILLIPVVTTVTTAAVNFRYFIVAFVAYVYLADYALKARVRINLLLILTIFSTYIAEMAWLTRQGFMI